jgi:hypothetical protein
MKPNCMVILGFALFGAFLLTINGAATSIELSGWNFTADLGSQWRLAHNR